MKTAKQIFLWVTSIFFALSCLVFLPSLFSIFAIAITILLIPIEKWQAILSNVIKGRLKIFIVVVLVVLCIAMVPEQSSSAESSGNSLSQSASATEPTLSHDNQSTTLESTVPPHTHSFESTASSTPRTCACGFTEVFPTNIRISCEPESPHIGQTGIFTPLFAPVDTTEQVVTWSSDAPHIVTIDETGAYQALTTGKATITATHPSGINGSFVVEVLPIPVESINLSSDWDNSKEFKKGNKLTLNATILPENAANKTITWQSSDPSVAKVSKQGVVTAVFAGNATITATSSNGVISCFDIEVAASPQKFKVTYKLTKKSTNHVGNSWKKGFEFNGESLKSGKTVSIMPGEEFTICGWAEERDTRPDLGSYFKRLTLTSEMCSKGFTIEEDFYVRENSGRYSGNSARWHLKVTFKPVK